jgi:hypothetical protein
LCSKLYSPSGVALAYFVRSRCPQAALSAGTALAFAEFGISTMLSTTASANMSSGRPEHGRRGRVHNASLGQCGMVPASERQVSVLGSVIAVRRAGHRLPRAARECDFHY